MRLDLQELEHYPSNKIPGFKKRLEQLMPSLYTHFCSPGYEGGFLERVDEGTWMGHIIEHIALELQTLAGMNVGFGRTRSTKTPGVYNVVFAYQEPNVGAYAAQAAVRIAQALVDGVPCNLEQDIVTMKKMREAERLGPSTASIVEEAESRHIPCIRLNQGSLVQLGLGKNQVRIRATVTEKTSSLAVDIAGNKEETKRLLKDLAIPVAAGTTVVNEQELDEALRTLKFPLVLKPLNGNHGKGASINIKTRDEALQAFKHAQTYSRVVIVERYIQGHDFRVLVINNKMEAAALRHPAHVKGDGVHNIAALIDIENQNPRRGYGHENVLTEILVDHDTRETLARQGYTLDSVPPKGSLITLKGTANLSTGGTSVDVTDDVHPENIFICERIARVIGLDICGIDIMAKNLHQPLSETGGVVLEVNAAPGFRMHIDPSEGMPRNVAAPVLDMLFPPGKPSRIPIVAVTGTNGKTTTTRLIAHIVKNNGYHVGFTTSDGIYIHNTLLVQGDTTGPVSAAFVLKDPTVEFAVLETARGGLLREGLGFRNCDIGVITNVQEDHLGLADIDTLGELANVKKVLIEAVKKDGWAVLNADNEYCRRIGMKTTHCNVAYFSLHGDTGFIASHCAKGGVAAYIHESYLTIAKGKWKMRLARLSDVPLTFHGTVTFMTYNALAAALTAFLCDFNIKNIKSSLETFEPSPAQTPGRMNLFEFKDYRMLVDYAHNPDGLRGIKEFIDKAGSERTVGVIAGTGDRREDDIKEMGRLAAHMFDKVIICQERYLRGMEYEKMIETLQAGIDEVRPGYKPDVFRNSEDAWQFLITQIRTGDLAVITSNSINNSYQRVKCYQENLVNTL